MRTSAAALAVVGAMIIGSTVAIDAAVRSDRRTIPGEMMSLTATAYCRHGQTASGAHATSGIVAADPRVLPVGSILRIDAPKPYAGIYSVMDTGSRIKGREIDIFVPDCARAMRFGRRLVNVRVLRRGWDPKASQ
jgi:peptidoglycan lytic transglycosylase